MDELFLTTSPLLVGDAGHGTRLRLVEAADLVPLDVRDGCSVSGATARTSSFATSSRARRRLAERADRRHRQPGGDGERDGRCADSRRRACRRNVDGSERTARLAEGTGLEFLPDLEAVVEASAVVLDRAAGSGARDRRGHRPAARRGRAAPRRGPERHRADDRPAARADRRRGRVRFVDGSISGPPPSKPGTTRLYLSGTRASEIADLPFDGVERIVVGDRIGDASAVKMSTASVYKGTTAVLTQALLAARANGVLEHVRRSRTRRAGARVQPGAKGRERRDEGRTLRRRDARDRRDAVSSGAHPGALRSHGRLCSSFADITRSPAPRGARERPGADGRSRRAGAAVRTSSQ